MAQVKLTVTGMDCGGCVKAVTRALHGIDKDAKVAVDLASGKVEIDGAIDRAAAEKAIQRAGFGVAA